MIFRAEERIDAPPRQVWRHLTDPTLMAGWMPGIEQTRSADGAPLGAGSRLLFTARGAERSSEVAAFEEGRLIALRSSQGGFTATYSYRLRPDGRATLVTLEADCVATGWARLLAPFIRPLIRRADGGQLVLLKNMINKDSAGDDHNEDVG